MTYTKEPLFAEVHNVPDDYRFTTEELDRIISGDMFTPRQAAIMAREIKAIRETALAALTAEPVMYASNETLAYAKDGEQLLRTLSSPSGDCIIPLYTAPPSPVVPDEMPKPDTSKMFVADAVAAISRAEGWNACRAAMLQGKAEPVSQRNELPEGWVAVPVEPTAEMQSAAAVAIRFDTTPINKLWTGNAVYKAMLSAAPQQEVK